MLTLSITRFVKDGAWAFVRSALSKEKQQNSDFFPVVQSVMDAQIALGLNGELEDKEFGKIKLEQLDAEKQKALIKETTVLSSQNETIYTIIVEEAKEYFAGTKTAEECARLIQNRVSIFWLKSFAARRVFPIHRYFRRHQPPQRLPRFLRVPKLGI